MVVFSKMTVASAGGLEAQVTGPGFQGDDDPGRSLPEPGVTHRAPGRARVTAVQRFSITELQKWHLPMLGVCLTPKTTWSVFEEHTEIS